MPTTRMYYRYEFQDEDGEWRGIFQLFDPFERRAWNRHLREPSWYKKHADTPSRCWFTEEGYTRFKAAVEETIERANYFHGYPVRLLKKETLDFVASRGKLQCIEISK